MSLITQYQEASSELKTLQDNSAHLVSGGTIFGSPKRGHFTPRSSLPPIASDRSAPVGSTLTPLLPILDSLIQTYRKLCGGRTYSAQLASFAKPNNEWSAQMLHLARSLKEGGLSPEGYVTFVVSTSRKKARIVPHPHSVFGQNAVKVWLPQYIRHGADVLIVKSYKSSPERRRAYEENTKRR